MKPLNLMSIGVASDHAGYQLKGVVKSFLENQGAHVYDFGTHSDASCDYPDYAHPLAVAVRSEERRVGKEC